MEVRRVIFSVPSRRAWAALTLLTVLTGTALAAPPPSVESAVAAYANNDLSAAAQGFTYFARQGDALAEYNLAMMHLRDELPHANAVVARHLLLQAARQHFVRAELALGQFYEQGRQHPSGTPDLKQAQHWYALAAAHGSVDAQVAVGTAFYLGRGARLDPAQAALWFKQAANGGDVGAQYLLASMYESGLGVVQDLRLARYWYAAAAANGDDAAPFKVKELDARLSQEPEM